MIGPFGSLHSAFVIPLVAIVHFCLLYKKRASSSSSGISDKMFSLSAEALATFTDFFFSTDATTWQALCALSNRWTVQTASTSDSGWLLNTLALTSWLFLYGLVFVFCYLLPACLSVLNICKSTSLLIGSVFTPLSHTPPRLSYPAGTISARQHRYSLSSVKLKARWEAHHRPQPR